MCVRNVKINGKSHGESVSFRSQNSGRYLQGRLNITSYENNQRNKLLRITMFEATYDNNDVTRSMFDGTDNVIFEGWIEADANL